jgi:energy-coupling factor transporter ATP-binding protein EcfA2
MEKAMIARTLSEVLHVFDPQRPLQDEQLTHYYVARPMSQLEPMRVFLEDKTDPVKVLFTGHRGSGKSTELNKLASMLGDKFFIVHFSILRILNPQDLTYVDLLLALAIKLFQQATDARLLSRRTRGLVGDDLLDDVYRWFTREVIQEKIFEPKAEAGAAVNLNLLAVKLG